MGWKTLTEAAYLLEMSKSALRSRGVRGTWTRVLRESDSKEEYYYFVPESALDAATHCLDRYYDEDTDHVVMIDDVSDDDLLGLGGDDPQNEPDDDNDEQQEEDNGHEDTIRDPDMANFVISGGNYIFNLPSKPRKPWVVPKEQIETLVSMYSNDGDKATINQISRTLGWHRRTVRETIKALGKTHDSLPFTDDQIENTDEDTLVEDLIRRKEEKVHVRASRLSWKKTQDLADKAANWQRFVENTLSTMVVPPPPPLPEWKRSRFSRKGSFDSRSSDLTIVSHATDLHYGKYGWVDQIGEEYSREVTRDRLLKTTEKLMNRSSVFGEPREAILGVGGDWFHIDNYQGTTTKGTPQDHDGCWLRIFTGGCALARDHIEQWRQYAPTVRVVVVRGNHDYMSTALLVHWLRAVYADAPDVIIGSYTSDREYLKVGNTLLGMTHGDGVKDSDLGSLMALEAKEHWSDTKYRMWITGHWHSQIVSESHGVLVEHAPSLAGSDAWHKRMGYVGNRKALASYLIDHEEGPFAKIIVDK